MRIRNDPPEVFAPARCGFGCGVKWEHWCKGCNLVYCAAHIGMTTHTCKRLDLERGCPGTFGPPEKPKSKPEAKGPSCEKSVSPPTTPLKKGPPCEEIQLPLTEPPKREEKRGG